MDTDKTQKYADTFSKMIRSRTVSCDYQEDLSCFAEFQAVLKELFPSLFAVAETELFGATMALRWKGKSSDRPAMFMNHQDVVPAEGNWKHDPFAGEISEGKIWGRGVLDDKGGLFAMLQAADELISEGFVPARDIWFVSSCCEEVTRDDGNCREVAETFAARGMRFGFVLDEGGMIVCEPFAGAKGTYAMVGVAERGCADLKFSAKSAGGHSSTPPNDSPLVRLGKFMAEADRQGIFKVSVNEVTIEMFRRLSGSMSGLLRLILSHPVLFKPLLRLLLPVISPSTNAMVRSTIAFTRAQGSEANNVIPQEAHVIGNLRFSHHQGRDGSIGAISRLAEKYGVETSVLNPGTVSGISSFKNSCFKLIEKAVSVSAPGISAVPYIMTGASDSRFMYAVSDNVYRFLPFCINNEQISAIHGIDENLDLSTLVPAVSFYRYMFSNI